jgi:transcriptional regulator with XRE-family HTH domain
MIRDGGAMAAQWIDRHGREFGPLLRAFRGAAGLTQEGLAERSGLSVEAISLLERGGRRAPRASTVEFLARALDLDPVKRDAFVTAARGRPSRATRAIDPSPRGRTSLLAARPDEGEACLAQVVHALAWAVPLSSTSLPLSGRRR